MTFDGAPGLDYRIDEVVGNPDYICSAVRHRKNNALAGMHQRRSAVNDCTEVFGKYPPDSIPDPFDDIRVTSQTPVRVRMAVRGGNRRFAGGFAPCMMKDSPIERVRLMVLLPRFSDAMADGPLQYSAHPGRKRMSAAFCR